MAGEYRVETRDRPRDPWRLWSVRMGTRKDAERSARGLLAEMRAEGLHRAAIRIDGRRVRKG